MIPRRTLFRGSFLDTCRLWLLLMLVVGCNQPIDPASTMTEEQSRMTIKTALSSIPAIFDLPQYNPVDDQQVEQLIDESIEMNIANRYFGSYPETESAAKSFGDMIAGNVWRTVLDNKAGRAAIERAMLRYWHNADVEVLPGGESVEMNLAITPGKIELNSKNYYTIKSSEFIERDELKPSELHRCLKRMMDEYPSKKSYRVRVVTDPSSRYKNEMRYEYLADQDLLYVFKLDSTIHYVSPTPVHGIDRFASGQAPTHTSELKAKTYRGRLGGSITLGSKP
jgi:hypothetical protein